MVSERPLVVNERKCMDRIRDNCIIQENVNISVFSFTSNCAAFQVLKLLMWNDSLCVETMSDLFIHLF